jgi:hypothetical protein
VEPVPDPLLLRKSGSAANRTRDLWVSGRWGGGGSTSRAKNEHSHFLMKWVYWSGTRGVDIRERERERSVTWLKIQLFLSHQLFPALMVFVCSMELRVGGAFVMSVRPPVSKWRMSLGRLPARHRSLLWRAAVPTVARICGGRRVASSSHDDFFSCKIWRFYGGDYEEWCLLGCYTGWLL